LIKKPISILLFLLAFLLAGSTVLYGQKDKKRKTSPGQASESQLREAEFFFVEAEKYFILEDYSKALLYFQRVNELNPENSTVHYKIAEILSKSNTGDDQMMASVNIEKALSLEKGNKYYYLLAANIYSNLTQFGKAAQALETMMKEIEGTEDYLYQLAAIYQFDNKKEEAIKTYNKAEAILGIDEASSLQKQQLYFDLGKTKEAMQEWQKLIEQFPSEERYVIGFAETLNQHRLSQEAIQLLEGFIANHTASGNVKMLLAGLYGENQQEEKARLLIEDSFDDPSLDVNGKVMIVGNYAAALSRKHETGNADPKLADFTFGLLEKLKAIHPDEPTVRIVAGDLYLGLGKKLEAKSEYLAAIHSGSTSFDAWQNLLFLESELNQFDSIIIHSEQGFEIFPNQAMLYYFNGYAYLRKNQFREATQPLEQAKRLSAGNQGLVSEINGLLGDAYNSIKDYKKSDESYEAALAFNPNNDLILNNYSYYLALRNEYLDKAEKMAAQAIKNNPANHSYLDTYAWVLFTRGKYKEAKKVMDKIIQTNPDNPVFYEHYGDILFKLGKVEDAVTQWEKAKALDEGNELINKKIANRKL